MADAISHDPLPAAASGASGRLARLAGARIAAQVLGFLWFIYAARTLTTADLGVLSSGLALVVVIGGLCDLGTSRTVVRHSAAEPAGLRANLRRALMLRVSAGVLVGAVATVALPAVTDLSPALVALAAWIAIGSGATEIDFAALRSIGSAQSEVRILVLERTLFTVLAVVALAAGQGPLVLLAIYGATNSLSAVLGAVMAHRRAPGDAPAGPFFDVEGWRTAVSSSLLILGPRASIVVLVLLGTTTQVAAFAVAQKPTEALYLLVIALAVPVLPLLRVKVVAEADEDAGRLTGHVAAAGLAAAGGTLGWLIADPEGALDLLLGGGSVAGAAPALRLLAMAATLAVVRGALELLLLAHERARDLMWATTSALIVTTVIAVLAVGSEGAAGAGAAALAGEAVALVLVARAALNLARPVAYAPIATSFLLVVATAGILTAAGATRVEGLVGAIVASMGGLLLAGGPPCP